LSAALTGDKEEEWNFRITTQRLIVMKTKAESVRKAAALDVLTNLSIALSIPKEFAMEDLAVNKEYLATLKVFTSKNMQGIDPEFVNFFDALDIDQSTDDFIKAYWVYPNKIRFELSEVEEP
jgi:hypothetical protein